ncbi:hypothetical protein [Pseudomonas azerbaijanorientalis]|uniref:hypothetical protein n=1 Tax=Pseudomonas azerbaijanorientalis TaxID=2842350 RepID=UPI001C3DC43B|nr:hypothetical protein [Pseudomonas azerbaijanorientalis]QXH59324.1 hypothetical protein KSS91_14205 [Pseudomonas azerbaijanorientalis]
MSRRSRSQIIELIQATMPWEEVSVQSLEPNCAYIYRHRKQALEMYMIGSTIESIKHATNIDGSYLKKMIKRCLLLAPDRSVYGYRALLPHIAIKSYRRTKEVDASLWQSGAGLSGVLGATFTLYPKLESKLQDLILKRKPKGKNKKVQFEMRPKDLHVAFINILNDNGHPTAKWPFNTKHRGIRTLTAYVSKVRDQNFERAVHITGDRGAIAHIPVGTGHSSLTKSRGLMEIIEIDSYTVDALFILILQHEYGIETYHNLKKLHLLAAVESLTSAVLWFYVVHGDDVTAEDVVALLRQMLSAKLPRPEFTIKDLDINPGAGFPAEVIPEMTQVEPSIIRLDNALAHLSDKISTLRMQTGCINEYGVPGRPERRPNIEHKFKLLAADLIQRFPNTTGAGPDKGRAIDPERAANQFRVTSDELDQLVYAYLANLNAEPTEGLRNLSPLEAVAQLVRNDHYIPRRPPLDMRQSLGVVSVKSTRTVKGGVKDGHRPYINFKRARYTSTRLMDSSDLVGGKIIIEVNESDIRVVQGFLENGAPIGPLTVQGDWAELPHSLRTRDKINSLMFRKVIFRTSGVSIIATYKRHLEANLEAAAASNNQDRRSASELDRLRTEQSRSASEVANNAQHVALQQPAPPLTPQAPIPEREFLVPPSSLDLIELVKKL